MTIWLRTTGSTMRDAAVLAQADDSHGLVVVAAEQTDGIGRQGHSWYSEDSGGLYMSIVLRLPLTPDALPVLTMAIGLATQGAVQGLCGAVCDLRWPNDLLLNGKKLAGILVQNTDNGALIAGIGVNVNQTSFPDELREIATSLRMETGQEHSKDDLLDRIIAESLRYASLLAETGKQAIFEEFGQKSSYVRGKQVDVDAGARTFSGTTAGLDENGFLRVETADGIETVIAGGVRARGSAA